MSQNLTNRFKGRVTDARGRSVKQIDPFATYALSRSSAVDRTELGMLLEHMERGLARQLTFRAYAWRVLLGVAGAGVAFAILWFIGDVNFRRALETVLTTQYGIWVPLFFSAFFVPLWRARRRHRREVYGLLIEHRLCPHCGYSLRDLPSDDKDGATQCPECGCAWKLGREAAIPSA